MATIKLGELLVKANVLQESQLRNALVEQQRWGGKLGDTLVRMSLVPEEILIKALSRQLNIPAANLDSIQGIAPHVKAKIPRGQARDLEAIPIQLRDDGKTLVVAMIDPQNIQQLDALRVVSRCRIVPQLAGRSALTRAFARFYDAQGRTLLQDRQELEDQRDGIPFLDSEPQATQTVSRPGPPSRDGPPAGGPGPPDALRALEESQRRAAAAIEAMVELLIEKGVFSREEYLAKVKR